MSVCVVYMCVCVVYMCVCVVYMCVRVFRITAAEIECQAHLHSVSWAL